MPTPGRSTPGSRSPTRTSTPRPCAWPRIWSRTEASAKNPKGLFRSSLWSIPSSDFELIATAGRR